MKKRLLLGLCAVLCICGCVLGVGAYTGQRLIVHEFNYATIKEDVQWFEGESYHMADVAGPQDYPIEVLEKSTRCSGYDRFGNLIKREPQDSLDRIGYGVIMVVKVKKSTNVLDHLLNFQVRNGEGHQILSPYKTYPNIKSLYYVFDSSHVSTTAEITDVIFQTEKTTYRVGDTVELIEYYYIIDERTPVLYANPKNISDASLFGEENVQKTKPSDVAKYHAYYTTPSPWTPMEVGETYLIYGSYIRTGARHIAEDKKIQLDWYGVYCLSDKTKAVGCERPEEMQKEAYAYIAEHFGY